MLNKIIMIYYNYYDTRFLKSFELIFIFILKKIYALSKFFWNFYILKNLFIISFHNY